MSISRVLVANRGEIAVRVIRACKTLGLETALAVSDADRDSLPARLADRTICIGPAAAPASYLNVNAVVTAALATGADALHPGYGFLAESPELAETCVDNGIIFIGPEAEHIRRMGHKIEARTLADKFGVPVLPGSEKVATREEAERVIADIGYPVMLKAAAGGGGRGMKIVTGAAELTTVFAAATAEARAAFGDSTLYAEKYIPHARHIEVQVLGDGFGNVVHLGERDCSVQRHHQKVVEEAPAPAVSDAFREEIRAAAVTLARGIGYRNAGTVEFIADQDTATFYFLEMNTRIQVEHPVSEMITGKDLVLEQLRIAGGERLSFAQSDIRFHGHAVECRINAERPDQDFRPDPGVITAWRPPTGSDIRLDTHCFAGYAVPPYYDSLLAKLIVTGPDRQSVLKRMANALDEFVIAGVATTVPFLRRVMDHPEFVAGAVDTRLVERML